MQASERISVFKQFGDELRLILDKDGLHRYSGIFDDISRKAQAANNWFSPDNTEHRIREIAFQLEEKTLSKWLSRYTLRDENPVKRIGVIAAGNIPAAGYDDFAHVLLAGHHYVGKLSSDDKILLPFFAEIICEIESRFKDRISFVEGKLGQVDAVLATGSNNSSRYFEYYFANIPHVIRKNRNSVGVLDGTESTNDLENLGEDVFRYFGLGCRNITKFFVPAGYKFDKFFEAIYPWGELLLQNRKYMNNYDYNRTIYMLNSEALLDNNFLVIKKDIGIASPPGVLYFEEYNDLKEIDIRLKADRELIQCVVSKLPIENAVLPGHAQKPKPWDYADGFDTLEFILKQ